MFFEDDIKELSKTYNKPELVEAELTMAKTLINSMNTPFNPSEYSDEYQVKLRKLIESKIAGKEIVTPQADKPSNVINLMDALKASIEQTKNTPPKESKQA